MEEKHTFTKWLIKLKQNRVNKLLDNFSGVEILAMQELSNAYFKYKLNG